jgi:lysophospholipase L1-like esterase
MKKGSYIGPKAVIIFILFAFLIFYVSITPIILKFEESTYFTTWATSIYTLKNNHQNLNYNSLRQIIRISASGDKIRLKISNKSGESNLEIKMICIADLISKSEIDRNTIKYLKFNGKNSVIIPKGKEIYSDTIMYPLKPISDVAISIYFGSVPKNKSGHYSSRTFSYIEEGNKITNRKFSEKNKKSSYFFIEALEVSSENPKKTVVFFGDSITDGQSRTHDTRNNYPDIFSAKFHEKMKTSEIAVINKGIDGDRLIDNGMKRYAHDVLNIKGVKYIVVLYGVNDLNVLNRTSSQIISAYKSIIKQAHEKNIYIYSGTILPFSEYICRYLWNTNKEKVRNEVNEWIRKTKPDKGGFDAVFDYDKEMKDKKNGTKLAKIYNCGDGIHPSLSGYQKMVECIKYLSLFTKE